ncbi:MAG TPA: histidinol-phosphate transaminase [Terriglobales bacterium]|nr:histidinol-phosphate transaminase [Terriglobales bacterium]
MSDFSQLVPEHVRNLGRYQPGKSRRQAQQESKVDCIKMASNENPFGPSPKAVEAMRAVLEESNYYPDNDVSQLRQKLAEFHGVNLDNIVPTAGSTALLGIIARTLLSPGLNAITSERSFIIYPIATRAAGGRLIQVPMRDNSFDLDAIAAAVDHNTRIIYLSNPNNPTGTIVNAREIDNFLDQLPATVVVILDEAYHDFAKHFAHLRGVDYSHALDYVKQDRKVVVLRTFSKAHGLAGVRVGYGIGPAEFMAYLARMRTTFSVSSVAQAAATAALEDGAHIDKTLRNNAEQAQRLAESMAELGFPVTLTWANFVYCELNEDAASFAQQMQAEGVIVRPLGAWGAPTAIRVSIGTPDQNLMFLRAFKNVIERATVRKPRFDSRL